MIELVASNVIAGVELHFVLVEEAYSEGDEPFTLFVHSDHYSAARREIERAFFDTLEAGQAYCRAEYDVAPQRWRSAENISFRRDFAFEFAVTNRGVAQPYPVGFDEAEVVFRLGQVEHPDPPSTPVLDVCGNADGLRRLAAWLLLCADGEQFDPGFHVHLDRDDQGDAGSDIDVTLRGPGYFSILRERPLRQWSATVNVNTGRSGDRPDAQRSAAADDRSEDGAG